MRAALDYCDVPYSIKEVHPLTKKETRDFAPDYKKVPVLTVAAGARAWWQRRTNVPCALGWRGGQRGRVFSEVVLWWHEHRPTHHGHTPTDFQSAA